MIGWVYIIAMVVLLPLIAVRAARVLESGIRPLPPRRALQFNTLATLAIMLGLAVAVGRAEHVRLIVPFAPDWRDAAAVLGFLLLAVALLLLKVRRLSGAHREKMERITMSDWRDPRQFLPYTLIALMAGVAEEVAYRGVLAELLQRKTGSWLAAVAIASLAFGFAHAVQGWRNAAAVVGFAAMFHLIVRFTGDLYAAICAHATYDLIAGFIIAENARRRSRTSAAAPIVHSVVDSTD